MKKELYEIIAKSLSGESSQKEEELLSGELERNVEAKKLNEKLRYFWSNYFPLNESKSYIKERTLVKMGKKPVHVIRFERMFRRVSAAVLIIGVSVLLSIKGYNILADNSITEFVSNTGEVKLVNLPDGSEVWLNSRSSVAYHNKLLGRERQVIFHGEGYFEVKTNKHKPFIVSMPDVNVKVHGTSFAISSYFNENDIEIMLSEGSIELINKLDNNKSIFMNPGEKATLNKLSGILKIENNEKIDLGWKQGKMNFYNARFDDITNKLERKYGVEIILLDKEVENLRFTADIENEKLDDILKLISKAHDMTIKKQGKKYFITKNN